MRADEAVALNDNIVFERGGDVSLYTSAKTAAASMEPADVEAGCQRSPGIDPNVIIRN